VQTQRRLPLRNESISVQHKCGCAPGLGTFLSGFADPSQSEPTHPGCSAASCRNELHDHVPTHLSVRQVLEKASNNQATPNMRKSGQRRSPSRHFCCRLHRDQHFCGISTLQ
jgi:hypothetical protein